MRKGIRKGMRKGIRMGIKKGADLNNREIAKKMKTHGIDLNLIATITNLPITDIMSF